MKWDSTERKICLKDMLFAALSQWKKWLLAAVILGLLLGGYKGVTTWMVATDATVHAEQVQEYEDVLYLPSAVLQERNGQTFVSYLDEKGIRREKEVTTGVTADGRTEITGGVEEGERVLR